MPKKNVRITTSKKLDLLLDNKAFQKRVKKIMFDTAEFMLGRHKENAKHGKFGAILTRGFGDSKGRSNKVTKEYRKLKPATIKNKAKNAKTAFGKTHFHIMDGNLFIDAISRAVIKVKDSGFTITPFRGKSKDYQKAQQNGSFERNIPPRPYYIVDEKDEKDLFTFMDKHLLILLKSNKVPVGRRR